jgi:hypothetical protein
MVGRIGKAIDSDVFFANVNTPDINYCKANGIDYQPCVLPGDLQERQHAHGDFMWRQFYNMVRLGSQGIYISMFDEYNEGNQIAKTAEDQSMVPSSSGFFALDEDGTKCSARLLSPPDRRWWQNAERPNAAYHGASYFTTINFIISQGIQLSLIKSISKQSIT